MILAPSLLWRQLQLIEEVEKGTIVCLHHEVGSQEILPQDSNAIDDGERFFSEESLSPFRIIELVAFIGDRMTFLEKDTKGRKSNASISISKGLETSTKPRKVPLVMVAFRSLKVFWYSFDHDRKWFFFKNSVNGTAYRENPSTNYLY